MNLEIWLIISCSFKLIFHFTGSPNDRFANYRVNKLPLNSPTLSKKLYATQSFHIT